MFKDWHWNGGSVWDARLHLKMIHIWHLQPWGCAERATQTTAIGPGMECETRIVTTVSLQLKAAYTTTKLTQLKKCTIGTQQKKAFHKINRKSNFQLLVYHFNWCSLHKVASPSFASQLIGFHSNQSVDAIIVLDCYSSSNETDSQKPNNSTQLPGHYSGTRGTYFTSFIILSCQSTPISLFYYNSFYLCLKPFFTNKEAIVCKITEFLWSYFINGRRGESLTDFISLSIFVEKPLFLTTTKNTSSKGDFSK